MGFVNNSSYRRKDLQNPCDDINYVRKCVKPEH